MLIDCLVIFLTTSWLFRWPQEPTVNYPHFGLPYPFWTTTVALLRMCQGKCAIGAHSLTHGCSHWWHFPGAGSPSHLPSLSFSFLFKNSFLKGRGQGRDEATGALQHKNAHASGIHFKNGKNTGPLLKGKIASARAHALEMVLFGKRTEEKSSVGKHPSSLAVLS